MVQLYIGQCPFKYVKTYSTVQWYLSQRYIFEMKIFKYLLYNVRVFTPSNFTIKLKTKASTDKTTEKCQILKSKLELLKIEFIMNPL